MQVGFRSQRWLVQAIRVQCSVPTCNSPKYTPPPRKYTPSMFWLRQNVMVIDLLTYTFEHYRFHHKLVNVIDGCM